MYRLSLAVLTMVAVAVGGSSRAQAADLYWDDFSDGSIAGEWAPSTSASFPNSVVGADTGDLRVSQTLPDPAGAAIATVEALTGLVDMSLRTQVLLSGGDHVEIHARRNDVTDDAYSAALFDNGNVYLMRFNTLADIKVIGSGQAVDSSGAILDVTQEDVVLQLDVFDDQLDFWAWRPTEGMPTQPTATAVDPDPPLGSGSLALITVQGAAPSVGSGDFRFVHVADVHIPEPSSIGLAASSLILLGGFRRRS